MLRLALSSFSVPWAVGMPSHPAPRPLTPEGLLRVAHDLEVPVVQFGDNLPLHSLGDDRVRQLRAGAERLGIELEVGMRGIDPVLVETYLRLALVVDSPLVRIVVDAPPSHPEPDDVVAALTPHAPAFRRAGIVLAIENHDRFTVPQLVEVVERLGTDWVGICLDTVNSFGALEGPDVVVEALAPYAVNLHVKDFDVIRPEHGLGFTVEGRPAGAGRLDIPGLLRAVHGGRFGPPVVSAVLELWTPPQRTQAETIELEAAWVRQSVAYLAAALASNALTRAETTVA